MPLLCHANCRLMGTGTKVRKKCYLSHLTVDFQRSIFVLIIFCNIESIFRLLMQSCRFFLPTFYENFKFLKNYPYDSHKILHSHFTPFGAPACAKTSKSYDWNVRNIAKIGQKAAFFQLFRFSQKLSIRFERNFLQSFSTP